MRQILGNTQVIGPSGLSPEDAGPTLRVWQDASDSSTITLGTGSQVASWSNKAASTPTDWASLVPSSAGPETSTINSKSSIRVALDGARFLENNGGNVAWEDIAGLNVGTMIVIASFTGGNGAAEISGWKSGPDNQIGILINVQTKISSFRWAGNSGIVINNVPVTDATAVNAYLIGKGDGGGADAITAVNSTWQTFDSDNDDISGDSGPFRFGNTYLTLAGEHIHFHEILIYNDALSQSQWNDLYSNHIKPKWGTP